MALQISDIEVRLSGGASNTDPDSSLGGAMSTIAGGVVLSQTTSTPTIGSAGFVVIDNAYSNPIGDGTLRWDNTAGGLYWKPFGGTQFIGLAIVADGTYVLGDSSGYLIVTVDISEAPVSTVEEAITVGNRTNNVFDAVSANEATAGRIEYRCLYIYNSNGTDTASDVRIWIKQQPDGDDELDIALDTGGKNVQAIGPINGETDDDTDLSGLTWSRPTSQDAGLTMGALATTDYYAFWEKRTVFAGTTQQISNDTSKIGISALI